MSEAFVSKALDALNASGVEFMVVGAVSGTVHGLLRPSNDADFVVNLGADPDSSITSHLGSKFKLDPQMRFETADFSTRYIIKCVESDFIIELFELTSKPHDLERFRRRLPIKLLEKNAYVQTAEDFVITKLRWFHSTNRSKDYDDVFEVVAVNRDRMDWSYVEKWCSEQGTLDTLAKVRNQLVDSSS